MAVKVIPQNYRHLSVADFSASEDVPGQILVTAELLQTIVHIGCADDRLPLKLECIEADVV